MKQKNDNDFDNLCEVTLSESQHCSKRRRLLDAKVENVYRPDEKQVESLQRQEKEDSAINNDHRRKIEDGELSHSTLSSNKQLNILETNHVNCAAFDAVKRIVAAVLCCKGISKLPMAVIDMASSVVLRFLHDLANETRIQAQISLRAKANLFDVTRALIKIHPQLSSKLFASNRTPLILSDEHQEFIKEVHCHLPLLRPFSSASLDLPSVDQHEQSLSELPREESPEYWEFVGEYDVVALNERKSDSKWEKQRRRWKFIDRISLNPMRLENNTGETLEQQNDMKSTKSNKYELQPYMPLPPSESMKLGHYHQKLQDRTLTQPPVNAETRQSQILEDQLYVQLLLPKILQEVPKIDEVSNDVENHSNEFSSDFVATNFDVNLFLTNHNNNNTNN